MSQVQQGSDSKNTLVAAGSNATSDAGDAGETVLAAFDALRLTFPDLKISPLYQTPAFPAGSGPDFVNAACRFNSDLDPYAILTVLHRIEADFGRERTLRWGQRTLDLDLIACAQMILPDVHSYEHWANLAIEAQKIDVPKELILPHPRLQDRPFVLVPLADIAPDWCHPLLGQTVLEMRDVCASAELEEIRPLK